MAVLVAALMIMGVVVEAAGSAAARAVLVSTRSFADPSIIPFKSGFFGLSTGYDAPGAWAPRADGPWRPTGPTLVRAPGWATSADVWAADAARMGSHYVMYFSVPVRGVGPGGRCIGAAVARSPLQKFWPARGDRPLVCPAAADARRAADGVRTRHSRLPRLGVIDPSVTRLGRRNFLLYKTQGTPATIRIVPLTRSGLTTRGRSRQLLRTRGISENPVIVRHGRSYYLFTSEGYYAGCGYSTTWRRSRSLYSWRGTTEHSLLRARSTGVCGPGGADIVQQAGHQPLVFFHGWVCGHAKSCSNRGVARNRSARRGLYAGRLVWRGGTPHVVRLGAATHPAKHHPQKKHPTKHRAKKKHHATKHKKSRHKKVDRKKTHHKRHATKRHHRAKKHRTKKHRAKRRHRAAKHHKRVKRHTRKRRTTRRRHRRRR